MQDAYKIANESARQVSSWKASSSVLQSGDRVLVRNLAMFFGSEEHRSHWENKVHVVVRRLSNDSPVKFTHLIKDIFAHCLGLYFSLVTICQVPVKLRFQRQKQFHQIHNRYLHHYPRAGCVDSVSENEEPSDSLAQHTI